MCADEPVAAHSTQTYRLPGVAATAHVPSKVGIDICARAGAGGIDHAQRIGRLAVRNVHMLPIRRYRNAPRIGGDRKRIRRERVRIDNGNGAVSAIRYIDVRGFYYSSE